MKIREGSQPIDIDVSKTDLARRKALAVRSSAEAVKTQRLDAADVARVSAEARLEAKHRMSVDLQKVDRARDAMQAGDLVPMPGQIAAGLAEDGG